MGLFRRSGSREVVRTQGPLEVVPRPLPEASTVPLPVRAISEWSWRLLVSIAALAALIFGLMYLSTVTVAVLVAVLLAALLSPVTDFLDHRARLPRTVAVIVTVLAAVGAVTGVLTLAGNSIVDGFPQLRDRAVEGFQNAVDWLGNGPLALDESQLQSYLTQIEQQVSANTQTIVSGALSFTTSAGNILAGALIAIFCLFFFLREGRVIWTWIVGLTPRAGRERVDGAGLRSWISLGQYTRTQILVAVVDGFFIGLGAYLLGVPLAIPLGLLVFLGAFIPIVGALISGTVAVAVALVDQGPLVALAMLGVVLVVQQVEGNVLQPLLMSRALKLHPVAVLLAVAAGTIVGGIVGALLSVPLIAVANTALKYLTGKESVPPDVAGRFHEATARWRT